MALRIGSNTLDMGGLHGKSRRGPALRTYVRFGHGVEAALVPRVAAAHASYGEPGPARRTVELERLERVRRARRVEAAARGQVPAEEAPGPDRQGHEPCHGAEVTAVGGEVGTHARFRSVAVRAWASASERAANVIVVATGSAPTR